MDSGGHIHHLNDEERSRVEAELISSEDERVFLEERKMVSLSDGEAKQCESMGLQQRKGWMRNKPCPCDSGKKFKKCCWGKFL